VDDRSPQEQIVDELIVVELTSDETHDVRRRVLRVGTPSDDVVFAQDADPATFHLGVRSGATGRLLAVSTYTPAGTDLRPGAVAWQLRGMAVDSSLQGHGVGTVLLSAAIERLRHAGAEVLWANARDSAMTFYERMGMTMVGPGFTTADTLLPHHRVVLDLPPLA
jgi:GNAT superfamily N-acetyltransferase